MASFDRGEFARVLLLAKGDRSVNQFGATCGVDPGYLSRLLRGLLANPPSPAVLGKIAALASNGINYQDLMQAAGFWPANEELTDKESPLAEQMQGLVREMKAFFRMQPLTDGEKETLIQDLRDYFQYKMAQTRKKMTVHDTPPDNS